MKTVVLFVMFFCAINSHADDMALARERLNKLGMGKVQFKLFKDYPYSDYGFAIVSLKEFRIYGVGFPPGTTFFVNPGENEKGVHGDTVAIINMPAGKSVKFQNYDCIGIHILKGNLLECDFARDTTFQGTIIPKGAKVHFDTNLLKNGVAMPVLIGRTATPLIIKGKPVKLKSMVVIKEDGSISDENAMDVFHRIHPGGD